jgi:hypothetical protein
MAILSKLNNNQHAYFNPNSIVAKCRTNINNNSQRKFTLCFEQLNSCGCQYKSKFKPNNRHGKHLWLNRGKHLRRGQHHKLRQHFHNSPKLFGAAA